MARTSKPTEPHIRWMIRRDMDAVLAIESVSFEHPWTEEDFAYTLRQRNCIGMVAKLKYDVVGFMVYSLHKKRLHLLDLAVHPEYRCEGIGAALIDKLKSKLSPDRRSAIETRVVDSNLYAQLWFSGLGFWADGVFPNEMDDGTPFTEYQFAFTTGRHRSPAVENRIARYFAR